MSMNELWEQIKTMGRRARKAKDPFTKYALISPKPMDPGLIMAKGRSKTLMEYFASPKGGSNMLGMMQAEGMIEDYESVQSGYAASPDVVVDEGGAWEIFSMAGAAGLPQGLNTLGDAGDTEE